LAGVIEPERNQLVELQAFIMQLGSADPPEVDDAPSRG